MVVNLRLGVGWRVVLVAAACAAGAAACGAKTALDEFGATTSGAGGGATTTTGGTTTSVATTGTTASASSSAMTSSGTGGSSVGGPCGALTVHDAVSFGLGPGSVGWAPSLVAGPEGHVYHFSIEPTSGVGPALVVYTVDALATWPPSWWGPQALAAPITDYAVGPGPEGPAGLLAYASGEEKIATSLIALIQQIPAGVVWGGTPLAIAGVATGAGPAFLFAEKWKGDIPGTNLNVGGHQFGDLPQEEPPDGCFSSDVLADVIPLGVGFLGAFGVTDPVGLIECNTPLYASAVNVGRYDVSPSGMALTYAEGTYLPTKDRLEHVAIARATFGAWVVYQSAGLDAEVPPPIYAFQVDLAGKPLGGGSPKPIAVSPSGSFPDVAIATTGDVLVVGWVDVVDPSAPTIGVQAVYPDLSLGASASLGTGALWFTGRLRMLGSPELGNVLLSWESHIDDSWERALARVDCVSAL